MTKKRKILIVDDSAFMRRVLSDIINSDKRCEVIGTAANGKEALEFIANQKPDVITLDVQMPIMNGLEMLKEMKSDRMIPVVMMSTLMKEGGKETIEALELGAYDFVKKPDNIFHINSDETRKALIEKVIEAADSVSRGLPVYRPLIIPRQTKPLTSKKINQERTTRVNNLVALGTSTGGPKALQYILPYLPSNLNAAIVIVQHMPPGFTKSLSDRMNQISEIFVKEAEDRDVIRNGCAYIAPGDKHLEVKEDGAGNLIIRLSDAPPRGGHKPSVNHMVSSITEIRGRNLIGVIMTGMGSDGAEGFDELKSKQKVHIIAQNESSCVVFGMPKSVIDKGIADEVVSLEKIYESIIKQTGVQ